ncbi:MAG: peptide chain release factor N(5)-glutamine methyltransferase [Dactylosporangium sp.]|nr:peptide chain release factor N(5)-glutamine methyltransferase [Dactylosporangium sp.]NNJ60804.1 peptide chain release factor N(5)-glutamine methyltransferase [Dactylosporangium sp.]
MLVRGVPVRADSVALHDYGVSEQNGDIRPILADATTTLARAGVATPRVDAELLAAHLLGVSRGALVLAGPLNAEQAGRYRRLVADRAARTPLQHLVGTAPFRRLELAVGPGVFIPRPETELLVDWGLAGLRGDRPVVVDLCSGSGAVALAVADEYPGARVHAVEVDAAALTWLRRNVQRYRRGAGSVTVLAGDATSPAPLAQLNGMVDLVLCNPPYVPSGTPVDPEVADHDPPGAVFGGPDGLAVIRGIVARSVRLLRPGGRLGIEHDDSHAGVLSDLLREAGAYAEVTGHRDLAGRPRFATAVRRDIPTGRLAHLPP